MHDTKAMQVFYTICDMQRQNLNPGFRKSEPSLLDVIKHVFASQVVKNDEVELTALEQIDKLYDRGVLAHLEDFDLTTLLEDFYLFHVGLLDCLYGDLHTAILVSG